MNFYLLCFLSFILCLLLTLILMPKFIKSLKAHNIKQVSSEYALEEFKQKNNTPIMGGLLFVLIPLLVYVILYLFYGDKKVLFILLSYCLYCLVGFIDDYLVIIKHNNDGLSPKTRLIMEATFAIIIFFCFKDVILCQITIPFVNIGVQLKWYFYLPFMVLLYMAEANAVNFTDGMDGLCAGVSFIGLIPFLIMSFIYGEKSISLLIACILGSLIGYLRFNFHPAKIFMGDSGSLALGALFASLGLILDKSIALFFIGGVFVIEMFCVCLQQISVRLFHKRIFVYTPVHYAFVIKGHKETNIVYGFYLLAFLLAIIGLIIGLNTL